MLKSFRARCYPMRAGGFLPSLSALNRGQKEQNGGLGNKILFLFYRKSHVSVPGSVTLFQVIVWLRSPMSVILCSSHIRMFLNLPGLDPLVRCTILHQAKSVKKAFNPTVLWLFYGFLSLKTDVNLASKSKKQKKLEEKNFFSCHHEGH